MGGWVHPIGGQGLYAFRVLENALQLDGVCREFLIAEREARQVRDLGDVDVHGHGADGTDLVSPRISGG